MAHTRKVRLPLGPALMKRLRETLPEPKHSIRPVALQSRVARLLGVGRRTVTRWEDVGAPEVAGWAFVGLAFRVGGPDAARTMLRVLSQSELDGAAVWGKEAES